MRTKATRLAGTTQKTSPALNGGSRWVLPAAAADAVCRLSAALEIGLPAAKVLVHRGFSDPAAASRFLQECMRTAADLASSQQMPSNLERAQVYDVLLWASELHGRLRRSPRKVVKFPILLRSKMPGRLREVRTEIQAR